MSTAGGINVDNSLAACGKVVFRRWRTSPLLLAETLIPTSKRLGTGHAAKVQNRAFGSGYRFGRGNAIRPRREVSRLIPIGPFSEHSERGTRGERQAIRARSTFHPNHRQLADPTWNTHVSLSPMGRGQFGRLETRRTGPGIFWRSESHQIWTPSWYRFSTRSDCACILTWKSASTVTSVRIGTRADEC
jgi:hypothetical protein